MKWSKSALLGVIVIFFISFVYSGIKDKQLSNKVKEEKLRICSEQGSYDCGLISRYHDECFSSSYRAQYKIKKFYYDEYNNCISSKIEQRLNSLKK